MIHSRGSELVYVYWYGKNAVFLFFFVSTRSIFARPDTHNNS